MREIRQREIGPGIRVAFIQRQPLVVFARDRKVVRLGKDHNSVVVCWCVGLGLRANVRGNDRLRYIKGISRSITVDLGSGQIACNGM